MFFLGCFFHGFICYLFVITRWTTARAVRDNASREGRRRDRARSLSLLRSARYSSKAGDFWIMGQKSRMMIPPLNSITSVRPCRYSSADCSFMSSNSSGSIPSSSPSNSQEYSRAASCALSCSDQSHLMATTSNSVSSPVSWSRPSRYSARALLPSCDHPAFLSCCSASAIS